MTSFITIDEAKKLIRETTPEFRVAEEKATKLAETFRFNEVIELLNRLINEVSSMPIAKRFSPDRKILSSTYADRESVGGSVINPLLRDLTERDFKRWQLTSDINGLKQTVIMLSGKFEAVVMDMEATKLDF